VGGRWATTTLPLSLDSGLPPNSGEPLSFVARPVAPARVVVLASGSGTLLQALLDAVNSNYPAEVVAVGSDTALAQALARAKSAGVQQFVVAPGEFPTRVQWDAALAAKVAEYEPDLVVLAGFMRLVGSQFLARFGGRTINSHPALLPAFPGANAVADALAYGVAVTGASLIFVGAGVDDGPILSQVPVAVHLDDDESSLHERIKQAERALLVEQVARLASFGWTIDERKVSVP